MNVLSATTRSAWVRLFCALVTLGGVSVHGAVRHPAAWAQGTILAVDSAHHVFSFVPAGSRNAVILAWNGHTHQWNLGQVNKPGQSIDAKVLTGGRPVRVLFDRQGKGLLAKRIIFLSPLPELSRAS